MISKECKIYMDDTHKRGKLEILIPFLSNLSCTVCKLQIDPLSLMQGENLVFSSQKINPFSVLPFAVFNFGVKHTRLDSAMDLILNTG